MRPVRREGTVGSAWAIDTSVDREHMKRRHPRQIVSHTELRPGDKYAWIRVEHNCAAQKTTVRCEKTTFVAALADGKLASAAAAIIRHPAIDGEMRLTTHCIWDEVVLSLWTPDGTYVDTFSDFFGDSMAPWIHQFIVPLGDWDADPRVHVIDWINPDDVCEAAFTWAEEEAELRHRRDVAMRRALGFE